MLGGARCHSFGSSKRSWVMQQAHDRRVAATVISDALFLRRLIVDEKSRPMPRSGDVAVAMLRSKMEAFTQTHTNPIAQVGLALCEALDAGRGADKL